MRLTVRQISPIFFFFNDTATTEIYTLSLHDALPILKKKRSTRYILFVQTQIHPIWGSSKVISLAFISQLQDRKSTRLNSSHSQISYAVFCLKKKKACAVPAGARETL